MLIALLTLLTSPIMTLAIMGTLVVLFIGWYMYKTYDNHIVIRNKYPSNAIVQVTYNNEKFPPQFKTETKLRVNKGLLIVAVGNKKVKNRATIIDKYGKELIIEAGTVMILDLSYFGGSTVIIGDQSNIVSIQE